MRGWIGEWEGEREKEGAENRSIVRLHLLKHIMVKCLECDIHVCVFSEYFTPQEEAFIDDQVSNVYYSFNLSLNFSFYNFLSLLEF